MAKRILIQLDVDDQPSTFDAVVAVDAGVDHLFQYGSVTPENVTGLVHGAMFTRGGDQLRHTALFIGGSDVGRAEAVFRAARKAFFGPVRVSILLDASGCNTTAAAAVASAARHVPLAGTTCVVLGATGPVGRRVALMLALSEARVVLTSRRLDRAESACHDIQSRVPAAVLEAAAPEDEAARHELLSKVRVVIACGAAGVELLSEADLRHIPDLSVAIDLNAVPPAGIGGIDAFDKAKPLDPKRPAGAVVYGPIGVGGLKMKTHKAAIAQLFETNQASLDAEEVLSLTRGIESSR